MMTQWLFTNVTALAAAPSIATAAVTAKTVTEDAAATARIAVTAATATAAVYDRSNGNSSQQTKQQ